MLSGWTEKPEPWAHRCLVVGQRSRWSNIDWGVATAVLEQQPSEEGRREQLWRKGKMRAENSFRFGNVEVIGALSGGDPMKWWRYKLDWIGVKRIWERRECRQQLWTVFVRSFSIMCRERGPQLDRFCQNGFKTSHFIIFLYTDKIIPVKKTKIENSQRGGIIAWANPWVY